MLILLFDGVPALGLSRQAHMGILTTVWSFVSLVMVRSLRPELGLGGCCCSGQKQLAVKLLQRVVDYRFRMESKQLVTTGCCRVGCVMAAWREQG